MLIVLFNYLGRFRAGSSKSELSKISESRNKWVKNFKNLILMKLSEVVVQNRIKSKKVLLIALFFDS